ncbi:MAG: sigma-70 family RNA polymerase sigma factor [Verrucomicrobiota bacterium]
MSDVTQLLSSVGSGDPKAAEELLPVIYDELRRLANARMSREPEGQTLQPTALVHEVWIRLIGENHEWQGRKHFFSAAAEAMRRILIDRARHKRRVRHGGGLVRVQLDDLDLAEESKPDAVLFVHDTLDRLAEKDPEVAELIKLRYFAGVPNQEAAQILGMSERTARRNWAYARAWLAREIQKQNLAE